MDYPLGGAIWPTPRLFILVDIGHALFVFCINVCLCAFCWMVIATSSRKDGVPRKVIVIATCTKTNRLDRFVVMLLCVREGTNELHF